MFQGTASNIKEVTTDLKEAEPESFSPIGDTVKDSIENSDSCEPADASACEVPSFEFLSAESDEPGPLDDLKDLLAKSDTQLIVCSGIIN